MFVVKHGDSAASRLTKLLARLVVPFAVSSMLKAGNLPSAPAVVLRLAQFKVTDGKEVIGLPTPKYKRYTTDDGLPENSVRFLFQSRDGYLWVATGGGIARFNGQRFVTISRANYPDLPSDICLAITEDRDGAIWIGTNRGLARFQNHQVQRWTALDGLGDPFICSLCATADGSVWIGTKNAVYQFRDGKLRSYALPPPFIRGPTAIHEDRAGRIWFAGDGLFVKHPGKDHIELCRTPDENIQLTAIAETGDDLWFGGAIGFAPGIIYHWTAASGFERIPFAYPINGLAAATSGRIALTSAAGIHTGIHEDPLAIEIDAPPTAILYDANGTLWFGGENGLFQLVPTIIHTEQPKNSSLSTWTIVEGVGGTWIGTQDSLFFDGGAHSYQYIFPEGGLRRGVQCLFFDAETTNLWVGFRKNRLYRFRDLDGFEYQKADAFNELDAPTGLTRSREGTLWLTTGSGAARFDEQHQVWQPFNPGFPQQNLIGVFEDSDGGIWFGSAGGGVSRWFNGKLINYSAASGVHGTVTAIAHEDGSRAIWAISDSGIDRFQNGEWRHIGVEHGLWDNMTLSLLDDGRGNYWFNSYHGIFRASAQDLNDVADGKRKTIRCYGYGLEDGAVSLEGNAAALPNSCRAKDGRLWFPTDSGAVTINPAQALAEQKFPRVLIEEFICSGKDLLPRPVMEWPSDRPIEIAPGKGNILTFRFSAMDLGSGRKARYKYRLEGRDRDWILCGNESFAAFGGLRPGSYRFHVAAANARGVWNETGATVSFRLLPFFHQTWTFRILLGVVVLGTIVGILQYRANLQTRLMIVENEAAILRERERISQDLHDDLGGHLARIVLLSDAARNADAGPAPGNAVLQRISENARTAIASIGELIWASNPSFDSVESLVAYFRQFSSEFFGNTKTNCLFSATLNNSARLLHPEARRNLFLAFKEALTNVAKHSEASVVEIQVSEKSDRIELSIRDNGLGLRQTNQRPKGHGLANIRRRVEAMKGVLDIQGDAPGTTILVTVPLDNTNV